MTRQRDNRSDWDDFSKRRQAAEPALYKNLIGAVLTSREQETIDALPKPRAERKKPVQWEAAEMEHLAVLVDQAWWEPGFERIEARSPHDGENIRRWKEGASSGFPDVLLIIPAGFYRGRPWKEGRMGDLLHRGAVRAALEMKTEVDKPKRAIDPQWWLQPFDTASRHGVRRDQARKLRSLHGAGFATKVAYGAAEAFSWLDEQAGPRPDVLPEEWTAP